MKKWIALSLALVMMLTTCLAMAETFKQGIDADYPPFSYLDENGQYAGFDVEVCQRVCELNGWEHEIVPVNWDFKLNSLDAGEHDCVWSGMTIRDSMIKEGYVLSAPYFDNTQVVLTRADTGITTLADLAGKRVAVMLGTSGEALLEDEEGQLALAKTFEGGEAMKMENFNICAIELAGQSVDAVVIDQPVAKKYVKEYEKNGFVILEETLGTEEYGICFRKGDEELRDKVEAALKIMIEDGSYLAIAEKWAPEGVATANLMLLNKD